MRIFLKFLFIWTFLRAELLSLSIGKNIHLQSHESGLQLYYNVEALLGSKMQCLWIFQIS